MRVLGLLALTTGIAADDQLSAITANVASRATAGLFGKSKKAKGVKRIAKRLTDRWSTKLKTKLMGINCWSNSAATLSSGDAGCAIVAVQHISADLWAWLNAHNKMDGRCANFHKRNSDKITRAVERMESKIPANNLRECPSGTCDGDRCVYDLSDGGFGGDGRVIGRTNDVHDDVIEFSNIQFGNADRFRSPVARTDFASPDFSADGKSCVSTQVVNTGSDSLPVDTDKVEDCLYIRIWMKKSALMGGGSRKVISWIHGGTWNFGGVDVIYESPATLVSEQDLIVAKMNYRLGPFGNWFFPINLGGQPKSGWSIQDQRMGMKWIKDNIAKFNGDADDITLGGASAGAVAVMVHMAHAESHDLFHNAMAISPPQPPFWSADDATNAYAYISAEILPCTTLESYVADLLSGKVLACLQSIPLGAFQAAMAQYGKLVFMKIAMDAGRITQLESAFGANIDGETITGDIYDLFKNSRDSIKQDMGFYVLEHARNEGTTAVQSLFSNPEFMKTLYGDKYAAIFRDFNKHVLVPQPAHVGLLDTIYNRGPMGPTLMQYLLGENTLGCQAPENDPYGGLLTDCKLKTSDWITAWLYTCNNGDSHKDWEESPLYRVDFSASYAGPNHREDGVMAPDTDAVVDCYEAGGGQACHIIGQAYLFGEHTNQFLDMTADQVAFGKSYRAKYADLMKNGATASMLSHAQVAGYPATQDFANVLMNNMDIGNSANPMENTHAPHAHTCGVLDMTGAYGQV